MVDTKIIGGKKYTSVAIYWASAGVSKSKAKNRASNRAKSLRKDGWSARVMKRIVDKRTGFQVYRRRK